MADTHPMAMRAGRPSPSPSTTTDPSTTPQYQQHYSSINAPPSRPDSRTQLSLANQSQPTNFSTRFLSNQYPPPQAVVESGHQPLSQNIGTRDSTTFLEHTQSGQGKSSGHGNNSSAPPRANTVSPSQNYPIAVSESISPQHSGSQPAYVHGNSRPDSRAAAASPSHGAHPQVSNIPTMSGGVGSASAPVTQATVSKSPYSTPITAPPRQRMYQILLINPNSTRLMTDNCLATVRPTLPPGVELTGYTAPYPAPTAIESSTDAIMSTETVLRDLAKRASSNGETVENFDGMIVACYSKHPLVDALRESYDVPVIGIMEASLYVARMLGARFGIVTTVARAKFQQEDDVRAYGLSHFYVGTEATQLGVLELETRSREEVAKKIQTASRALADKGADTILLGCAGMSEMIRAAKDGVRDEDGRRTVNVIDAVEAAVQLMSALVGMGLPTSKKGMFKGEKEGRRARGQNWL